MKFKDWALACCSVKKPGRWVQNSKNDSDGVVSKEIKLCEVSWKPNDKGISERGE